MLYSMARVFFGLFYKLFFGLEVIGLENVPESGPVIIASNHVSNLDPPTLGTALKHRQVHFMAKAELFKNPVFSYAIRQLGAFPVKRGASDRGAIKTALDTLKNGRVLAIFPEGTRSKDGKLKKFESGVISFAAKTGAAIVPSCIIGAEKLGANHLFPKLKVVFGKPYHVPHDIADKEVLQSETNKLMKKINLLLTTNKKD